MRALGVILSFDDKPNAGVLAKLWGIPQQRVSGLMGNIARNPKFRSEVNRRYGWTEADYPDWARSDGSDISDISDKSDVSSDISDLSGSDISDKSDVSSGISDLSGSDISDISDKSDVSSDKSDLNGSDADNLGSDVPKTTKTPGSIGEAELKIRERTITETEPKKPKEPTDIRTDISDIRTKPKNRKQQL